MRGLSLGVVGLTLAVALKLSGTAITDWRGVLIGAAALGLVISKRIPVILVLALAALAGYLFYG